MQNQRKPIFFFLQILLEICIESVLKHLRFPNFVFIHLYPKNSDRKPNKASVIAMEEVWQILQDA